jgi:hypothetical protein
MRGTTTTVFPGVLAQRASGMGWGQIAHSDGLNLGKVVSGTRPVTHAPPVVVASTQGTGMAVSSHHVAHAAGNAAGSGIVTASGSAGSAAATHGRSTTVVTAAGTATAGSLTSGRTPTVTSAGGAGAGSAVSSGHSAQAQVAGMTTAVGATPGHHGGGHGHGGS